MSAQPVDLIGGFYTDDALPWARQDTVNWLPVAAEVAGTLTVKYLKTPPGLKPYQNIGTGPIRGTHDMEGVRFTVSGRYLYRISPNGVGIPIGIIPGVGRVSMNHNQFKTGYQLLVENGLGGGGYVYDSTTQTMARITDPGYPGSISSDYLDSYFLGVEPKGRFWFHSNLADATDFNTLDRYESEASPDRIVGLAVSQFEVVVFNQRTIEFFYNSGAATGTFQNRRQTITRGCASRHTIAKLDNTLFWLGDDGIVYRMAGYSAQPISTGPMHRAFAGLNWSEASAFVWEDEGFKVYYLTFPDGRTWGYDVVSGLWTRRESYGLDRWRIANTVKWGGKWYAGDYRDGRHWELNWDYVLEGDQEFVSTRISPVMSDNQSRLIVNSAELIFDTGQGPLTEPIPFPEQPPSPIISGTAVDAAVGAPYSYTYTATSGTPAYVFSITGGELPPGLSLSAGGVLSGAATALGSWKFTVRVTDINGLWDEVTNTLTVSVEWWMITNSTGLTDRVWTSIGLASWSSPLARSPSAIVPGDAALGARKGFAVIGSMTTAGETASAVPVGSVINNTALTLPISAPVRFRRFGSIIFAIPAGSLTYGLSQDGGATWSAVTTDHQIKDIGRLASGRWVTYASTPAPAAMRYSDQAIPTAWTVAISGDVASGDQIVGTAGNVVIVPLTLNRFWVSQNGATYTVIAPVSAANSPGPRSSASVGNTIYFVGQQATGSSANIIWTSDAGLSWQGHRNNQAGSLQSIVAYGDILVASGNGLPGAGSSPFSYRKGSAAWVDGTCPFTLESSKNINIFPVERP